MDIAGVLSAACKRADDGNNGYCARVGKESCSFGNAAYVFGSVGIGKAKIFIEAMPHVVGVEDIRKYAVLH